MSNMFKWLNEGICALNNYLRQFEDYLSEIFDDFGAEYYYEPEDIYDDDEEEYDEDEDFYF